MKTPLPHISKNYRLFFGVLMVALLASASMNATNYYAITNGNWNMNTTWSLIPGGGAVVVGVWPLAGDDVYISEGALARSVSIPADYTAECANIYMGAASNVAATLTFASSTSVLAVSGAVIIYGPTGATDRIINVNAGSMNISGNLALGTNQAGNQANRVCKVVITSGTTTVHGDLVFNNIAGSSPLQTQINMTGGAGTFNLAGAFTINNASGTLIPGTTSTFNFNGSAAGQTIPVGVSSVIYHHLLFNNTNPGGATLSAAITGSNVTGNISVQTGALNNGGFAITLASTRNFSVSNGATFNLTGTSTMVSASGGGTKTFGPTSTVHYAGASQSVTAETYGHIIFSGSGTKTMPPGTTSVLGNWTNNGTVDDATNGGSTIFCGPAIIQTIGGSNVTSFFDIVMNNPAGVILGNDEMVINTLTLTSGVISTGAFKLDVSNAATGAISGASASSYISGKLNRAIAAGVNSYNFPIGTATAYAPVSIGFNAGTEAGSLSGFTTNGDHGSIGTSIVSPTRTVNRTWSFSIVSGLATANYDATFHWVSSDQDAGFDYSTAYAGKYTGSSWTYPAMGTLAATSAQITGESGFSDFQVGNSCYTPPSATISGDTAICTGTDATLKVVLTGTANWSYTWSDGTNTGTVSGVSSSPSYFTVSTTTNTTYTIIYVSDGSGCAALGTGSADVSIGPVTTAPVVNACAGNLIEIPITVSTFNNIGALSMTMNYDKAVMTYDSYNDVHSIIDYVYKDETGPKGIVRFSGISESAFDLEDDDVLITLKFNYIGGYTDLTWDDSEDSWCEYATGAPNYKVYCDNPPGSYYIAGSVTDASLVADFKAGNLTPPTLTDVQLTDLSTGGATSWLWSFDRPGDVLYTGGSATSQNPKVQFTDGGLYTVTLTVYNAYCEKTAEKIAYIRAGLPGVWDGPTSSDWDTETNWDNHVVPTAPVDVIIPTRPMIPTIHFYPHVPGALTIGTHCNSITLTGLAELYVGGVFTVNPGKILDVKDNAKVYANGY